MSRGASRVVAAARAVTLLQPWATLVVCGIKRIETRSWSTSYRGPLLIHASARFPRELRMLCSMTPFRSALLAAGYTPHSWELPLGGIIGCIELVQCVKIATQPRTWVFPNPARGRYAWITQHPQRFRRGIRCRGRLGLWKLSPELAARVECTIGGRHG